MKINPLHNFIFSYSFPFLEIVLQSFLMLKGTSIIEERNKRPTVIFWFFLKRNSARIKQMLFDSYICINMFRKTYFFNPQFQLGFHIIF
jgi:hypothetical protein